MCCHVLSMFATLLLTVASQAAENRTWTDVAGKSISAKWKGGVRAGKIVLTKEDGTAIEVDPKRLSETDKEYLRGRLEAWRTKKESHTTWRVRAPQLKTGVRTKDAMIVPTPGSGVGIENYRSSETYTYRSYGYQPVVARIVSYSGTEVVLESGMPYVRRETAIERVERTFKYALFSADDQKFLDEFRIMEAAVTQLASLGLSPSTAPDPGRNQEHRPGANEYRPGTRPVSSGTGFCIAQGNYLLTNYHVVKGAFELRVHLNGSFETYHAKLIAANPPADIALLKVELPSGKKGLVPIPLATSGASTGEDVCALGWPGLLSDNSTLTMTKGVVSTVVDAEGSITTDCKVNPGNSGGPLCNYSGAIVGMVTAKSQNTNREDSYGVAISAERLRTFLAGNLHGESAKLPDSAANVESLKTDELYRRVAPSVVYIENIQQVGRSRIRSE